MAAAPGEHSTPIEHRRAMAALIALSVAAFCYVTTEVLPIGLLTLIGSICTEPPHRPGCSSPDMH